MTEGVSNVKACPRDSETIIIAVQYFQQVTRKLEITLNVPHTKRMRIFKPAMFTLKHAIKCLL